MRAMWRYHPSRNGCCVSCLLKENFEAEVEASAEVFEGVLERPMCLTRNGGSAITKFGGSRTRRNGCDLPCTAAPSGRIVALKRVLTYHADSHETLARFRR
jgi:hypothetical protein